MSIPNYNIGLQQNKTLIITDKMSNWVNHPDRRKCKNCGRWCELSKKDDFSGKRTWRDMCHTCHDVRTDQKALALLAVGNKLQFLNKEKVEMGKKVATVTSKKALTVLENIQKEFPNTQFGRAITQDLEQNEGKHVHQMYLNKERESIESLRAQKKKYYYENRKKTKPARLEKKLTKAIESFNKKVKEIQEDLSVLGPEDFFKKKKDE